jgi:hypothetical protein
MNHRSEKKRLEIVQPEKQKRKLQKTHYFRRFDHSSTGKKRKDRSGSHFFMVIKLKKNKTLQQQLQSKNPRTIATTATKMTPGTRDFEKENWGGKKKKIGDRN